MRILRHRPTSVPMTEVLPSQGVVEKPPDTLSCGLACFYVFRLLPAAHL